ncbi:von Willebrand factor type A [Arabidopsis suecica]|uniref:RING-type E3 ubiquitin transferase n=1 Tax=Arabidopsis suecica TaxID=45249 RepID=A0A8T1XRC2_ARASU|nr:von Willebrand factor type A [Arabidopsis suecica]
MGTGWRRAFCTTAPRNSDAAAPDLDKQRAGYTLSPSPSPRSCVKLAFLSGGGSNPSTPRPSSSPSLRCRTTDADTPKTEQTSTPRSATKSPRLSLAASSNPSSPRSPLKLSLFRNSFKFRSTCGICLNSVKTGQGTAKYTAECSHSFHFPCIADYVRKHGKLVCPVCNSIWKDASLLAPHRNATESPLDDSVSVIQEKRVVVTSSPRVKPRPKQSDYSRFYDDDEPLLSPRFVTIPEADENCGGEEEDDVAQFKGFVVDPNPSFAVKTHEIPANGRDSGNVQVSLLPEAAVVSVGCGYETRAVALRVKAPPPLAARGGVGRRILDPSQRAPVDLVVVVDVGGTMNGAKLQMVKRAMRLVISSLGSADRLSIVAVVMTVPKRLLPLKRMTENGKRSAGAVVDGLLCSQGSNTSEALKKATRVLEDRRERNPVASIVLLTDGQGQSSKVHTNQRSTIANVGSTRFAHIEIPVTEHGFGESGGCSNAPAEEAFAKCIGGLLSVVVQDLRIQTRVGTGSGPCEISAIYLCNGRPTLVSSGSGSVRLGDLYAGEERELLVELRVPSTATRAYQVLSVRGLYKDPSTQEVVYGRDQSLRVPQAVRSSSSPRIERLRSLFIATRAVAESRRLVEYGECTSAYHLLTSARALLGQSGTVEAAEYIKVVEAELVEVQWRGQQLMEYQSQHQQQHNQRRRGSERETTTTMLMDENGEPLTPASAWRAAEKLAKLAMMKKSDLHGFENARF